YAVECIDVLPDNWWVRIDHHRPGDPGYGRPPAEFLAASSIGQVIAELAKTGALRRAIPNEIVHWMVSHRDLPVAEYNEMLRTKWFWSRQNMPGPDPYPVDGTIARGVSWIYDGYAVAVHRNDFYFEPRVALIPTPFIYAAAADHCLGAAYRGECPGVDPDALMRWRVERRATFQGRSAEQILADVEATASALREAFACDPLFLEEPGSGCGDPQCSCHLDAVPRVADMRREPPWPELPEASCRTGIGYVAGPLRSPDGRRKITCGGTPEQSRAFLDHWAPAHGLVDCYGDPARGFAGGYLKEQQ